jgi:CelD/BcsL family acetyltransferase involved in cellulose biosynthesis
VTLRIDIVTDPRRLHELEAPWQALWERCPEATPFQSPAWLLPWWQSFGPGSLHTIVVWDGVVLRALAPLYVENQARPAAARLLPIGVGVSDYTDILVDDGDGDALSAVSDAIAAVPEGRVEWPDLHGAAACRRLPAPDGWVRRVMDATPRPVLACGGDCQRAVPAAQRRKLRMARHRADRSGGLVVETVGAEDTSRFLAILSALHRGRWAERGEEGVLADPRVIGFHAAALPRLARAGLLRAAVARVDGHAAGAYYGLAAKGRCYAYLGGFDPAWEAVSPGTLLLGWALEEAATAGAREFDFLRGQEAYKYRWGAVDRPSLQLVMERAS